MTTPNKLPSTGHTWLLALEAWISTIAGGQIGGGQALAGPGAADLTHLTTDLTPTGTLDAITLADGTKVGHRKRFLNLSASHTARLTPATPVGFAHIDFTAQFQTCELEWNGSAWALRANGGVTVA